MHTTKTEPFASANTSWMIVLILLAITGGIVFFSAPRFGVADQNGTKMTVSYTIIGDGSPAAPVFTCTNNGETTHTTIPKDNPTVIECDDGTAWDVTPNPLDGSGSIERWYSTQPLSGLVTTQSIAFTFYHQYALITSVTPVGSGTTDPAGTSWQDAYSSAQVTAHPGERYMFTYWLLDNQPVGTGNPYTVTMTTAHILVAEFSSEGGFCPFVSSVPPGLPIQPIISPNCPINPGAQVTVTAPKVSSWHFTEFKVTGATYEANGNETTFTMPAGQVIVLANYAYTGTDVPGRGAVTVPASDPLALLLSSLVILTFMIALQTTSRKQERSRAPRTPSTETSSHSICQ